MNKVRIVLSAATALMALHCSANTGESTGATHEALIVSQGPLTESVTTSGLAEVNQPQTFVNTITNGTATVQKSVTAIMSLATINGSITSHKSSVGACVRVGPSSFVCSLGDLAPGATATVTGVAVPNAEGALTMVSTAAPSGGDMTEDDTTVNIGAGPTDVQITGFASTGSPAVGSNFSYTFQVKNNGPIAADAVSFSDTFPASLHVGSMTPPAGATCSIVGQTVSCSLGNMAVGNQQSVVIGVTAPSTAQSITDTASVATISPDTNTANNHVSITVQAK